jgi:hypothetical protein
MFKPMGYAVGLMIVYLMFWPAYNEFRAGRAWVGWLLVGLVLGPLTALAYLLTSRRLEAE